MDVGLGKSNHSVYHHPVHLSLLGGKFDLKNHGKDQTGRHVKSLGQSPDYAKAGLTSIRLQMRDVGR